MNTSALRALLSPTNRVTKSLVSGSMAVNVQTFPWPGSRAFSFSAPTKARIPSASMRSHSRPWKRKSQRFRVNGSDQETRGRIRPRHPCPGGPGDCGGDVRGDPGEVVADAGCGDGRDPKDPADGGMNASPAPGRGGPPRRWNRRSILRGPADGKRGGEGGQRRSLRRNRRPGPPNGWIDESTESRESSFRVPRDGPGRANTRVPDARREAAAWPRGRMKHTGQVCPAARRTGPNRAAGARSGPPARGVPTPSRHPTGRPAESRRDRRPRTDHGLGDDLGPASTMPRHTLPGPAGRHPV